MTFFGEELFSTLSNDSWANFFVLNLILAGDVLPLLILALLQQTPRMQLIFAFTHFFTDVSSCLLQQRSDSCSHPLDAICRDVPSFLTASANSDITVATFSLALHLRSCPRSWTTVPFQHDSLLFHLFHFRSISVRLNWDPFLRSIHFASCSILHCLHCKLRCFSVPFFERFHAIGSYSHADLRGCTRVTFLHLGYRVCRGLLFVSNIPKPSFVLVCLVDEVPEDVIELLHIFSRITFANVADQRCIRQASDVFL